MTYGLEVWNDGGYLQISDKYATHVVADSGTISTDSTLNDNGIILYQYTLSLPTGLTNKDCLVWARPSVAPNTTPESISSRQGVDPNGTVFYLRHTTNTDLEYMITTPSYNSTPESGNYGLEVWDETGLRVFSSKQALVHPITMIQLDPNQASNVPPAFLLGNLYSSTTSWASYYALINTCYISSTWGFRPNVAGAGPRYKFYTSGSTYIVDIEEYWIAPSVLATRSYSSEDRVFSLAEKGL